MLVKLNYEISSKDWYKFQKKLKYTTIFNESVSNEPGYHKKGKPKKGASPDFQFYRIKGCIASDLLKRKNLTAAKGKFILATNDLDSVVTRFLPK